VSEYQYYEFQAVDRPLTQAEIAQLRALSTRAQITPTRFQNVYHYGDFRGEPLELVQRYFDGFVYVANWGTRWCMLRLPRRALDAALAQPYALEDAVTIHVEREHVILEFRSDDEEDAGWIDDEEAAGWLPALLPLRGELARGDLRALYVGWLACVAPGLADDDIDDASHNDFHPDEDFEDEDSEEGYGPLDDAAVEPPVPPGLGTLSPALQALADFLRVGPDLTAAAAERSPALSTSPSAAEVERWVVGLPAAEKDALLLRLAAGEALHLPSEMQRQLGAGPTAVPGERTVAALRARAVELAAARRRDAAERVAAERTAYLDSLVGREEELWRQVDTLIEAKRAQEYDQAVELLTALRDLSARQQQDRWFAGRLDMLRQRYRTRSALLGRLDRAGLRP
jgi:hypothetical protein